MDIVEAMYSRHSVRAYTDKAIPEGVRLDLETEISQCNKDSGLNIQLITNEPQAFSGAMARYGKLTGVSNYIALIGRNQADLHEKVGYYGQKIVLKAQQLGLNTCWIGLTFSRGRAKYQIGKGEKVICVLALGYGQTQGVAHKNKPMEKLCHTGENTPEWFVAGMQAVLLAPTAVNQQKFYLTYAGNVVDAKSTGGFYSKVDLGIAKLHFEIGAGPQNFSWA